MAWFKGLSLWKKIVVAIGGLWLLGVVMQTMGGGSTTTAPPAAEAPASTSAPSAPTEAAAAPTEAVPPTAAPEPTWVEVLKVEGKGTKNTESFTAGKEWKISWDVKGDGHFSIQVKKAGDPDGFGDLAANCTECGADSSIMREPGEYFLDISSTADSYVITVENKQ